MFWGPQVENNLFAHSLSTFKKCVPITMLGSYTVKVIKNMGPDAYMGLTVSQERQVLITG